MLRVGGLSLARESVSTEGPQARGRKTVLAAACGSNQQESRIKKFTTRMRFQVHYRLHTDRISIRQLCKQADGEQVANKTHRMSEGG
jgi:hypothetical protein